MITLIFIILIIAALVYFQVFCQKQYLFKNYNLKENVIVKKFNRLLNRLNADNITTIKEKLLNTLQEYRVIKAAQFTENRTHLTEALTAVAQQISIVKEAIRKKNLELLDSKGKISDEEGARLMYDLEIHKDVLSRLDNSYQNLHDKIALLDSKIVQFDSNLALRKAKIVSMIADAISINDRSYIDLRLDSLEKEFRHEITYKEQEQIVAANMGETSNSSQVIEFDLEKYKELYKEFK